MTPPPAASRPTAPPRPARPGSRAFALMAAGSLILVLAEVLALAGAPGPAGLRPGPSRAAEAARLGALEARVAAVEGLVDDLEARADDRGPEAAGAPSRTGARPKE